MGPMQIYIIAAFICTAINFYYERESWYAGLMWPVYIFFGFVTLLGRITELVHGWKRHGEKIPGHYHALNLVGWAAVTTMIYMGYKENGLPPMDWVMAGFALITIIVPFFWLLIKETSID